MYSNEVCPERKEIIISAVLDDLLKAHKRLSVAGNVKDLLRLSKYLLKLADKYSDILIYFAAEHDE